MFTGETGHKARGAFLEYSPLDERTVLHKVELLFLLATLFLLDIMTTQIILRMGGAELNPLMAGVVANPVLHLGIKAIILLLVFLVSLIAEKRVKGSCVFFYGVLILLYSAVVLHNMLFIVPKFLG